MLSADLRDKMIHLIASYNSEGMADDGRRSIEETFYDIEVNGQKGLKDMSDQELMKEFNQDFIDGNDEESNPEEFALYHEAEAQMAVVEVFTTITKKK